MTRLAPTRSCTKFKRLFSRAAGDPQWNNVTLIHNSPYLVKAAALSHRSINALLADPRSVRAVLLRDPVERFISAYAEKVVANRCELFAALRGSCDFTLSVDGIARFMRDYPRWVSFDHMAPQVNFCGFRSAVFNGRHVWNRIGYYEPSTIANVASQLFDGRLDTLMRNGWGAVPALGMWDRRTVHMLAADKAKMLRQVLCANGTVLQALRRAFAEDYEFFKLPELDWCPTL